PIKTYYALDLSGIAAVNDSVGGVDVVSPETIQMFTEGESYHLEGKNAEHFVRLRDRTRVDSSLLRLERQKIYAKGFISTMMGSIKKDITSSVRVFNESAPYSVTNLDASKVLFLATELVTGGSLDTEMKTIPGKMRLDEGLARYDIDEDAFFRQFLSVFYEPMQ
ncbi:MAG: LCP family protein, partial [Ruminococcus sp.]|nr:LCP family protein [Ruminococcus sp.]